MLGLARPVRMDPRSSFATETAFSIFSSASKSASSITTVSSTASSVIRSGPNQCADLLTGHRTGDIALYQKIEHQHRHLVVHTETERGGIGDLEPALEHLLVGDFGKQ